MRLSNYYAPTLKEAPADAEVISHKLLVRAGMIRRVSSGIYNYLPLGWKSIRKIEEIIRQEMDKSGALEIRMPSVQPGDLWQESGRWTQYGKELLRFKDRHDRDYCLGPTHEEVITDMIRNELRSYRQLPVNMYQIQTKFRDEIRPRFGLMRGREFTMKDAYSFDATEEGADKSYHLMFDAYMRIFMRLGLNFRAVEADSGSIGGSFSHEFMVLALTGEDTIISCTECEYAANIERAVSAIPEKEENVQEPPAYAEVFTPAQHSVEDISTFLNVSPKEVVKTMLLDVDGKPVAALLRGDRELNEIKLKNYLNAENVTLASPEQVAEWTGAPVGFAGPVGLTAISTVIADLELSVRQGWVTGANKVDTHLQNVSLTRDALVTAYTDIRCLAPGDPCPRCKGPVQTMRGIEVGHVFKLGTKYSEAMNALFVNEQGKEEHIIMGCFGIGVTRVLAACIEQNNDVHGILFPPALSPFDVTIINLDPASSEVSAQADAVYSCLKTHGIDPLLDDREERPGIKFKDADLMGIPMQLIVGTKGLAQGIIETKDRRTGEKGTLSAASIEVFLEGFKMWQTVVYKGWETR